MHFGDPVVLLRKPFRLSFAYAGPDRIWKTTWRGADKLPAMIRLTVRDAGTERVLSVSTITPVHVQVPSDCVKPDGGCDDKDKTDDVPPNAPDGSAGRDRGAGRDAMTRDRADASSSEQGVVIVAVLWILMALSALAVIFSLYLSASAQALAVNDTALQTEALVSASLELTAYQLTLAGDKARPPRGSFHFRMNDADVLVTFTSEAARIDLNFAPKEMLAGLFAGLGANKDAAKEDADRIVGWRTRPAPGGTNDEEALYHAAGLNYPPRQSLFTHVSELALVVGLPPALVDRALPFVTVFNGSAGVDAAIAAPEVIAALPDKASDKPKDASGERSALPSDAAATHPLRRPMPTAAKSPCYRIEATINFSDGRRAASEVVIALGDKVEPYRVLSWQDDVAPRGNVQKRRGYDGDDLRVQGAVRRLDRGRDRRRRCALRAAWCARAGSCWTKARTARSRPGRSRRKTARRCPTFRFASIAASPVRHCRRIGRRPFAAAASRRNCHPVM